MFSPFSISYHNAAVYQVRLPLGVDPLKVQSGWNVLFSQVTRLGHEHCDITEGELLDITPLVVDNKKLVTLYDKDLTEGINLLIGKQYKNILLFFGLIKVFIVQKYFFATSHTNRKIVFWLSKSCQSSGINNAFACVSTWNLITAERMQSAQEKEFAFQTLPW